MKRPLRAAEQFAETVTTPVPNAPAIQVPDDRIARWLAQQIERGRRERFVAFVAITSALADEILRRYNTHNRPISLSHVRDFEVILQEGRFILSHQGMGFTKAGVLLSGQHRLQAIINTGITAVVQITFGCEPEEFEVVDQTTRVRNAADIVGIEGHSDPKSRAALGRIINHVSPDRVARDGQSVSRFTLSQDQNLLHEAVVQGRRGRAVGQASGLSLAYWWIAKHTQHRARLPSFWESLVTGENVRGMLIRERDNLLKARAGRQGTQVSVRNAQRIVLMWNSWVRNRQTVKRLPNSTTEMPGVV